MISSVRVAGKQCADVGVFFRGKQGGRHFGSGPLRKTASVVKTLVNDLHGMSIENDEPLA
jgi:hypothetical protein